MDKLNLAFWTFAYFHNWISGDQYNQAKQKTIRKLKECITIKLNYPIRTLKEGRCVYKYGSKYTGSQTNIQANFGGTYERIIMDEVYTRRQRYEKANI